MKIHKLFVKFDIITSKEQVISTKKMRGSKNVFKQKNYMY